MSSPSASDSAPLEPIAQIKPLIHEREMMETNHDSPARTMEDLEEARHDHEHEKDDAATMAASEELKHTTISDRVAIATKDDASTEQSKYAEDKEMEEPVKAHTPEPATSDAQDEEMRERISSPKKKRGRDLDDDAGRDVGSAEAGEEGSSVDGAVNGSRTTRSEPEKKRPRDTSVEPSNKDVEKPANKKDATASDAETTETTSADIDAADKSKTQATFGSAYTEKPQTSSSAFASSGFASLASAPSPFGTLAASKPSVFGGNVHTTASGFGALAGAKSAISTSTITATAPLADKPLGFAFGSGTTSGFGGLGGGSAFGSALGNGFAGGSGPKLSSFAAPVKKTQAEAKAKPAKQFGAPDSDNEEGSDGEDSEGGSDNEEEEGGGKLSPEEKRKTKTVKVEDGESSEATLLTMRAKIFAIPSKDSGWKERGVGTLKVNVPKSCVDYDENGQPEPGSFDLSGLEGEDEDDPSISRVPRLIMRQENTHRVILNTAISKTMEFKDKPSTTTAQIMFTAFEGETEPKPVQMLLKISEANARLFRSEIASIQREL